MSEATQPSSTPVSSSTLCRRLTSRWRSWICVFAIAREVTQLADWPGRHEARLEQSGLGEPAQPRGIRHTGLATRDLLDVTRVDQQALQLVPQDRPRRLPIDAGGLHHHPPHAMGCEPVTQRQQAAHGDRELGDTLLAPPALAGHTHPHGHLRLMDIQRRRALDDRLHLPPSRSLDRRPEASKTNESGRRARSTLQSSGETPHAKLNPGSHAPRTDRHHRRPRITPLFTRPRGSATPTQKLKAAVDVDARGATRERPRRHREAPPPRSSRA